MDDKTHETQQELFEEFSPAPKRGPERFPSIARSHKPILISTTLEQILMTVIVAILILCGVFFLGVLRGKAIQPAQPRAAVRRIPQPVRPVVSAPIRMSPPLPARPMATPEASTAQKPYTIQLVTHRKKEYAENEAATVRRMGYPSEVVADGEYYLVRAGQYASKAEAKKDLAFFSSKYKDCYLRRR